MTPPRIVVATMLMLILPLMPACGGSEGGNTPGQDGHASSAFVGVSQGVCVLLPTFGTQLNDVTGIITVTQTKNGLLIVADVRGLQPNSKHGFHINRWGDISDTERAAAVGPHYNPAGMPHSLPGEGHMHGDVLVHMTGGHAGGLGNLETDGQGNASFNKIFENLTLVGRNGVLGRSFVIHLDEDKGAEHQPDGDAGPIVAQGVIGIADPEAE